MNKRRPLLGLLKLSISTISGSLILVLGFSLILGIAAQIFEEGIIMSLFPFLAMGAAPFIVLMKSEGTAKWEQYLIAMPVRRKDLATSLYLNVFVALLLGLPVLGAVWGLGILLHDYMSDLILQTGFTSVATVFSNFMLLAALLFPLGCTKLGKRSEQGLFLVCALIVVMVVGTFFAVGNNNGLSDGLMSLISIAVTGIAFVVSMFITRGIYSKIDF